LQEVAPQSLDDDFAFMRDLGYDEHEMFKKGRFRPATFWKSSRVSLVATPVHKDRTLLTVFEPAVGSESSNNHVVKENVDGKPLPETKGKGKGQQQQQQQQQQQEQHQQRYWYILNCHLQAGGQAQRRLRQIMEGIKAVVTAAKKLKGTESRSFVGSWRRNAKMTISYILTFFCFCLFFASVRGCLDDDDDDDDDDDYGYGSNV
jgi:hypothetical protein